MKRSTMWMIAAFITTIANGVVVMLFGKGSDWNFLVVLQMLTVSAIYEVHGR